MSTQSVSRAAPAAAPPPPPRARALGPRRLRMSRAATLRARCGGRVEPVETPKDVDNEEEEEAGLAPEELELLEEEAMGGGDQGRRPTDYDRRAHIFETSSRVFGAIKKRRDGGVNAGAATAEQHATDTD